MIGVLVTTHGNLGNELIKAAELIRGSMKGIVHIAVDQSKGVEDIKKEMSAALKKLEQGQGVLILTDLFGGTPSNLALSFLKTGRVEVITGVNLPMLIKLTQSREKNIRLFDLAQEIKSCGQKNISVASDILKK